MNDFNPEDIESILGPMTDLLKKTGISEDVKLPPSNSHIIPDIVSQRIEELLLKPSLNTNEITLLAALFTYKE